MVKAVIRFMCHNNKHLHINICWYLDDNWVSWYFVTYIGIIIRRGFQCAKNLAIKKKCRDKKVFNYLVITISLWVISYHYINITWVCDEHYQKYEHLGAIRHDNVVWREKGFWVTQRKIFVMLNYCFSQSSDTCIKWQCKQCNYS